MLEVFGTLLIGGLIGLVVYGVLMVVTRGGSGDVTPVERQSAKLVPTEIQRFDPDLTYNIKFEHFIRLCEYSRNGKITVPDWDSLGDTEAERARNLLLIRDNNIELLVEATDTVFKPQGMPDNSPRMPVEK